MTTIQDALSNTTAIWKLLLIDNTELVQIYLIYTGTFRKWHYAPFNVGMLTTEIEVGEGHGGSFKIYQNLYNIFY